MGFTQHYHPWNKEKEKLDFKIPCAFLSVGFLHHFKNDGKLYKTLHHQREKTIHTTSQSEIILRKQHKQLGIPSDRCSMNPERHNLQNRMLQPIIGVSERLTLVINGIGENASTTALVQRLLSPLHWFSFF